MLILTVQSMNLLYVFLLNFVNLLLCRFSCHSVFLFEFNTFPDNSNHVKIRVQEEQPSTEEDNPRKLESIHLESQPMQMVECSELFMLIQSDRRVNCVPVLQSVLDKAESLLDINSHFVRSC